MNPRNPFIAKEHIGHSKVHVRHWLTCDEFVRLVKRSEGRCDRCGKPEPRLVIEHDHEVGHYAVRGLTCQSCNIIISCVDRCLRNSDPVTDAYLLNPFHLSLTAVVPGLRPRKTNRNIARSWRDNVLAAHIRRGTAGVENLLSLSDMVKALGISRDAALHEVRAGRLPGWEVGGELAFRPLVLRRAIHLAALRKAVGVDNLA